MLGDETVRLFLAGLLMMGSVLALSAQPLQVPIRKDCVEDGQMACYATSSVRLLSGAGSTFLAVRTGPGIEYEIFARLNNGDVVTVITSQGVWSGVELRDGRLGWVHGFWLENLAG